MNPAALSLCAAAAAALYMMRPAEEGGTSVFDSLDETFSTLADDFTLSTLTDPFIPIDQTTAFDTNVAAFLQLIRFGESGNTASAYAILYGGSKFSDFSQHPGIFFTLPDGRRTSAAGAYQITQTTWNSLRRQYDLPDFSPTTQDFAAVCLIKRRGALGDVEAGRFDTAIRKCRQEWTSLPGAAEARYSLDKAHQLLVSYGGTFDQGNLA